MGRHGTRGSATRWVPATLAVVAVAAAALGVLRPWERAQGPGDPGVAVDAKETAATTCARVLRVAAASSFVPVLARLSDKLDSGADCVRLVVSAVNGRSAPDQLADLRPDVWIPDDASWGALAPEKALARTGRAHSGTVVATSPIYLVTDQSTARRVKQAGGSWSALARLLTDRSGVRLAVRDPAGSGDGMVAAGSLAEAVWVRDGMDASAMALISALPAIRTVRGDSPALPARAGEVGLVPEYALLSRAPPGGELTVLGPSDHTGLLRFAWLPTASGLARPDGPAALNRLFDAITGPDGAAALAAARLRRPNGGPPPNAPADGLPRVSAKPYEVLGKHHVEHVFAAWYPADRRTNLLIAVDVSGSMSAKPDGKRQLIELVRQGLLSVGRLLPDDAQLGLWEFGTRLDGPRDYKPLLPVARLGRQHRNDLRAAVANLQVRYNTGTGLYDTVLAAYQTAIRRYRAGVVNHVLVFTDGKNEADPNSMTPKQLARQLARAADPERPVELTIAAFGSQPEVALLEAAVKDIDSYVEHVEAADEVAATFVHVAAGAGGHGN
jgi:hypothetical protein